MWHVWDARSPSPIHFASCNSRNARTGSKSSTTRTYKVSAQKNSSFLHLSSSATFSHKSTFLSLCPKFSEFLRWFRSLNQLSLCLSQVLDLWNFSPIDWTDFILYSYIFCLRFRSLLGYFSRPWILTDSSFLLGLLLRCFGNEIYLQGMAGLSTILSAFFWTFCTLVLLCKGKVLDQC